MLSYITAIVGCSHAIRCYECKNCEKPIKPVNCPREYTQCYSGLYNGVGM